MFNNKEKTQKPKVMEINVVAKNTAIIGDIISEGDFRIDGTLEGNIKTKGRVIIGVSGSVKGKIDAVQQDLKHNAGIVGLACAVSSVKDVKSPIGLVNGGQINGQIGDLT